MNVLIISTALRVVVCCAVFAFFVFIPLKSRFRYDSLNTAVLVALLVLITTAITVLFFIHNVFFSKYSSLGIVLWLVSAILIFCLTVKGSYFEILFIVLVVLNLYVNIIAIVKIINNALSITDPVIWTLITIAVLAAYVPLLWVLMFKLYKQVIEFDISLPFWKFIWIIPALTYLIFFVKIINDYWMHTEHAGTGDIVFSILWSFTTYAFFAVALQMLIQAYKGITTEEENKLIASQLRMQEAQYKRMLEQIETTARIRHDLRHHLISIGAFAEDNDLTGMKRYLADLIPDPSLDEPLSVCQNHIADVILQYYAAMAKNCGTEVKIRADIPQSIPVSDLDLCIILGNLMRNALEACEEQKDTPKRIKVRAGMKGRQLAVIIENTYINEVLIQGDEYKSTKHEGKAIGLSSVKRVVEKYQGILKIDWSNGLFRVYLFL